MWSCRMWQRIKMEVLTLGGSNLSIAASGSIPGHIIIQYFNHDYAAQQRFWMQGQVKVGNISHSLRRVE